MMLRICQPVYYLLYEADTFSYICKTKRIRNDVVKQGMGVRIDNPVQE